MRIVTRHNNDNRYLYIFMYVYTYKYCDMCLYTVNMSDFPIIKIVKITMLLFLLEELSLKIFNNIS